MQPTQDHGSKNYDGSKNNRGSGGSRGLQKLPGAAFVAVMILGISLIPFVEATAGNFGLPACSGNDGAITRSVNGVENLYLSPTTYTVNSGVVMTSNTGASVIFICATVSITINGSLDATNDGAAGGAAGSAGTNGYATAGQAGTPGVGDGAGTGCNPSCAAAIIMGASTGVGSYRGAGGGGAESSSCGLTAQAGGGGGGGARSGAGSTTPGTPSGVGGTPGAGGRGGGSIYLIAPTITLNTGSILTVNGTSGTNAVGTNCGGGGGGAAGIINLWANTLIENGLEYATGGNGGNGGGGNGGAGGLPDQVGGTPAVVSTGGSGGGGGGGGFIIRRVLDTVCSNCESITHANNTWEGQVHANNTWEGQVHANNTWEGQVHANNTWEGQVHANNTWEGQVHANITWCPNNPVGDIVCLPSNAQKGLFESQVHANNTWEGQIHANNTWEGQVHANDTWCAKGTAELACVSNGYANLTFEGQIHANNTWCTIPCNVTVNVSSSGSGVPKETSIPIMLLGLMLGGCLIAFISRSNPIPGLVGCVAELMGLGLSVANVTALAPNEITYMVLFLGVFLGLAVRTFFIGKAFFQTTNEKE